MLVTPVANIVTLTTTVANLTTVCHRRHYRVVRVINLFLQCSIKIYLYNHNRFNPHNVDAEKIDQDRVQVLSTLQLFRS